MNGVFYTQSEYSIGENLCHIDKLVERAKDYGYKYLSIADTSMYGYYKFYELCLKNDIKPIIGLKLTVLNKSKKNYMSEILLYAKNNIGLVNLNKLSTLKQTKKDIYFEDLATHSNGLVCITAGVDSRLFKLIFTNNTNYIDNEINLLKSIFSNNYYIGFSRQAEHNKYDELLQILKEVAKKNNVKIVIVHNNKYFNESDREVLDILSKICKVKKDILPGKYEFLDCKEISDNYFDCPEFIKHTNILAHELNINLGELNTSLPSPVKTDDSRSFLYNLCMKGLSRRVKNLNINKDIYVNRLNKELEIINTMGFNNYFLIVYDFILYAKKNNILVGPGRGSAAGSLVSYVIGITEVDPIKYSLYFERFLNPERITMPDIDVDLPDNKRAEVITYLIEKYGKEHVAQISAFNKFKVKSSIRDVSRILEVKEQYVTRLTKSISDDTKDFNFTLDYTVGPEIAKVLKIAAKLFGLPRTVSTHASGVIITFEKLQNYSPLDSNNDICLRTQLDGKDVEKLNLLKIDLLSVSNLRVLANIIDRVKSIDSNFSINEISLDDEYVYRMLSSSFTTGIFQLETYSFKKYLKVIKPSCFNDLVALQALNRPGALSSMNDYAAYKSGKNFNIIDPILAPILNETYGIILYQEQIMKILEVYAGYTLGEADILRRAISKKDRQLIDEERNNFLSKSSDLARNPSISTKLYDLILRFGDYGFNKSHSVAYSLISYQMSYLKYHYRDIFYEELLTLEMNSVDKLNLYLYELKMWNLKLIPPLINKSTDRFKIKKGYVLFPLTKIKGFSQTHYFKVLEQRNKKFFENYKDFKVRCDFLDKSIIESMIYSNSFRKFNTTIKSMVQLNVHAAFLKHTEVNYITEEFDQDYLIDKEEEHLGLLLSINRFHNFSEYKNRLKQKSISDLTKDNKFVDFICIIDKVTARSKNDKEFAFIKVKDEFKSIETVIFNDQFKQYKDVLKKNNVLFIKGRVDEKSEDLKVIINEVKKLDIVY